MINKSIKFKFFFFPLFFIYFSSIVFCQNHHVAAGTDFSVIICSDGKVSSAGNNTALQMGTGNPVFVTSFPYLNVAGLTNVNSIESGDWHTVAIKTDSTVWAWGRDDYGQLGDNSVTDNLTAQQTYTPGASAKIAGIWKVSGGWRHTILLQKKTGNVFTCGYGLNGELGNNTNWTYTAVPVYVKNEANNANLSGIIDISAGYNHNLAIKSDGTGLSWGGNASGQLGNGSITATVTPTQVSTLTNLIACAAGNFFSVFLKSDGTVWTVGKNDQKQLGNGTSGTYSTTPVQVQDASGNLTGVVKIFAGDAYAFALKSDGTLWGWGNNTEYQLGDTVGNTDQSKAVLVGGVAGKKILDAAAGSHHTVVQLSDNTNKSFGAQPVYGELGDRTTTNTTTNKTSMGGGGGGCTLLPVELINFSGSYSNGITKLNWQTASEINNDYFSVERSADGKSWEAIGTVKGFGNSSTVRDYEFKDESPLSLDVGEIYYRLQQFDFNGQSEFFGPIVVRIAKEENWILLLQNTPAENELLCTLFSPEDGKIISEICDLNGKAIIRKSSQVMKGSNLLRFNMDDFSTGVYFIKITSTKGNHVEKKFVKDSR